MSHAAGLPPRRRLSFAALLLRTLEVDALRCARCAAPMVVLAFLTDPRVVRRILAHLGLPPTPPPLGKVREPDVWLEEPVPDELFLVADGHEALDEGPGGYAGRGPPGAPGDPHGSPQRTTQATTFEAH